MWWKKIKWIADVFAHHALFLSWPTFIDRPRCLPQAFSLKNIPRVLLRALRLRMAVSIYKGVGSYTANIMSMKGEGAG